MDEQKDLTVTVSVYGDGENSPEEVLHHLLRAAYENDDIGSWSDPVVRPAPDQIRREALEAESMLLHWRNEDGSAWVDVWAGGRVVAVVPITPYELGAQFDQWKEALRSLTGGKARSIATPDQIRREALEEVRSHALRYADMPSLKAGAQSVAQIIDVMLATPAPTGDRVPTAVETFAAAAASALGEIIRLVPNHPAAEIAKAALTSPGSYATGDRVQEAARVLLGAFSDDAPHRPQGDFWMAYVRELKDGGERHYHGLMAGLRALARKEERGA